ncbi:MAG TPA: ABC transporter permease [Thermoanaerobaculia bacterium]|nr:ABC transporter permease [Thermoanaerobaculia bacterium]
MKSLSLEVALAYLKARSSRLVSSVSLLSIAGIGLGVAALVVAMGLLSGYRGEIRENLIGANAEVVLFPLSTSAEADPDAAARRVARVSRVRATAPVIYQSGLGSSAATPDGTDVVLKGIDAVSERRVSKLDAYLPGAETLLTRGTPDAPPGVAIGVELARVLDVREGDTIVLAVPDNTRGASALVPRSAPARVARIFRTNFYESDSELVFLDREVLRRLARIEGQANVIEIKLDTIRDTESAARAIADAAGKEFSVTDWRSLNGGLFSALAIQQTTLFFVIGLIVAVSTFNIVATLVMTVQEKKRDIGVLTALGAEPNFFRRVFVSLGALLGGAGVVAGVLFGVLVCWVMTAFRLLRFPPGVAEIYFVSFIPFRVRPIDLFAIVGFSVVVILLASWLPARRAGRVDIAEALRYE